MFESKVSRLSVVVCISGLAVVVADLSLGHLQGNRPFVATSLEVPDSRFRDLFAHPIGLVHTQRSCEFRSKAAPNETAFPIKQKWYVFDPHCPVSLDKVIAADKRLFGVPAPSRREQPTDYDRIALEMAIDIAPNAWLLTGLQMGLVNEPLIEKALGSPLRFNTTGLRVLQDRVVLAGRSAELPAGAIETITSCIREEQRICVQTSEHTSFTLIDQMKKSWPLSIGTALLLIGAAGAFFLSPIAWMWNRTAIKLFDWIRRGD